MTDSKNVQPKATSTSAALSEMHLAYRLFGPLDPQLPLKPEVAIARREMDKAIKAIVLEFGLHNVEPRLRAALFLSAEAYWNWWAVNHEVAAGLGEKADVRSLARVLKRAANLLCSPGVRNRLEKVASQLDSANRPPTQDNQLYWLYAPATFESVSRAAASVAGLLEVSERACELDGRDDSAKRRDDIRAAATPLRAFWTEDAGRAGTLTKWGTYSPAVLFLHQCLLLIDPTISEQLIVDLDQ